MTRPIINWATTSRQFCGKSRRSISPVWMAAWRAASSIKSSTLDGRKRARGMPPTWWPARPMRWSAVAISPGLPTCNTKSTEPMSIPISRDEEVTTARRWPSLSLRSTSNRMFLSIEPWCPATKSPRNGRRRWTIVSVIFLVLAKTSVVVWALIRSAMASMLYSRIFITGKSLNLGWVMRMSKSSSREPEILAIDTFVIWPLASRSSLLTRYSATVSKGSIVAEIPILWTPRLVETIECNSSMIMYATSDTIGWNRGDVMAMAKLSGVVMRIWGGLRSIFCRSDWDVSPVRRPTRISWALSGR